MANKKHLDYSGKDWLCSFRHFKKICLVRFKKLTFKEYRFAILHEEAIFIFKCHINEDFEFENGDNVKSWSFPCFP